MTNTGLWLRNGKFVDLDVDSLSVSWINLENVGFICRIGLVYRITCLLVLKISTDILYLMYSNSNEILFSYFFGALSICLVSSVILYLMIFECSHLNQAHCTAVQQFRLSSNRTKKKSKCKCKCRSLKHRHRRDRRTFWKNRNKNYRGNSACFRFHFHFHSLMHKYLHLNNITKIVLPRHRKVHERRW